MEAWFRVLVSDLMKIRLLRMWYFAEDYKLTTSNPWTWLQMENTSRGNQAKINASFLPSG